MRGDVPAAVRPSKAEELDSEVVWGLQREMSPSEVVLEMMVAGDPKTKGRPRLGKGGRVFTPQETVDAEIKLSVMVRNAMLGHRAEAAPSSFGVLAIFFTQSRQRRDVDNMLKLLMDAITMANKNWGFGVWVDDSQVSEVSARMVRNDEFPRTHLRVYRTMTEAAPTARCQRCGKEFKSYASQPNKHCSRACAGLTSRVPRLVVPCRTCGQDVAYTTKQPKVYCNQACRRADPSPRTR